MYKQEEATSISQYLLDKTSDGPRIMEYGIGISCKCYVMPRETITQMADEYPELHQNCIYVLIGFDENGEPMAYIGKSKDFSDRKKTHEREKHFWNKALVFISKANDLFESEILYLEHLAQTAAKDNGTYRLDNHKIEPEPGVSTAAKGHLKQFFKYIKLLTTIYGCSLFEKGNTPTRAIENSNVDKAIEEEVTIENNKWIITFSPQVIDVEACCKKYGEIFRHEASCFKEMKQGDTGYLYYSSPVMRLLYEFEVVECHQKYKKEIEQQSPFLKNPEPVSEKKKKKWCRLKITSIIKNRQLTKDAMLETGITAPQSALRITQEKYKKALDFIEQKVAVVDVVAENPNAPTKQGIATTALDTEARIAAYRQLAGQSVSPRSARDDAHKLRESEETLAPPSEKPVIFKMKEGTVKATLEFYRESKRYVIKAKSTIAAETKPCCSGKASELRNAVLMDANKSKKKGDRYQLLADIELPTSFNTPSSAAVFCNGRTANGPHTWKTAKGKKYPKEWWQG